MKVDNQKNRFDFFEKVRIASRESSKADIFGKVGAIVRKARGDGGWSYEIKFDDDDRMCHCWEHELEPTGEFDSRENALTDDR